MKGLDGVDGGPGDGLAGGHYYVVQRCVTRRPTGSEGPRSQDYSESRDERATEQGPEKAMHANDVGAVDALLCQPLTCLAAAKTPEDRRIRRNWIRLGMNEASLEALKRSLTCDKQQTHDMT